MRESLREGRFWEGQGVGGTAFDCLRGLVVSEREVAGTTGLGTELEQGGVGMDLSQGLVFCLRKQGLNEGEVDAARSPGEDVR